MRGQWGQHGRSLQQRSCGWSTLRPRHSSGSISVRSAVTTKEKLFEILYHRHLPARIHVTISSLPAAIGEFEPALRQPRRPDAPAVRILRILRALRLRALREIEPADDHPAGPAQESQLRAVGSSLARCCLRRLRLFNFRPAQIKECPHDDRNHWPVRASRIGCDICLDLSDKKCIR